MPALELSVLVIAVNLIETPAHTEQVVQKVVEDWNANGPVLTTGDVLDSPSFLIGTLDQLAEKLQRLREKFGISYPVIFEREQERLAPLVKVMAGK